MNIAASYRKRGFLCILQNKKYAFLRRKTKSTHFCGENKKYALLRRIFQIKMDISVWTIVYHMTGKERGKNGAGMDERDIS